jgi:hypothetical protein
MDGLKGLGAMENIMLIVKFLLFYGMWFVTLSLVAAVVFAVAYQFLRSQIRNIQKGPFRRIDLGDNDVTVLRAER